MEVISSSVNWHRDVPRYGRAAVALHWIMAVLIVVVGTLGLLHDSWPRSTQAFWINLHALIGLTVFNSIRSRKS